MFKQLVAFFSVTIILVDAQLINNFINRRPVPCRSPLNNGEIGECKSMFNCPWVRWDARKQRQFACFRNILTIGVCCPSRKSTTPSMNDLNQQKPIQLQVKPGSSMNFNDSTMTSNLYNPNRPFKEIKNSTSRPFQTSLIQSNKNKNIQKPMITISISAFTPFMNTTSNSSLSLALNSTSDNELLNLSTLPQLNEALLNATISAIKKSYQSADKSSNGDYQSDETADTIYMKVINDLNQNNLAMASKKQTINARSNECGITNQNYRIVGGHPSIEGGHPWMAAIFLERQPNKREFWCGGALISDQFVLSAAHCLTTQSGIKYSPTQIKVRLGTNWIERNQSDNLARPPANANQYLQEFDVDQIRIHENFQRHGFLNDIALIKLNRKVDFNERIKCICLPTENDKHKSDFSGLLATVLGWGSLKYGGIGTNQLQEVTLPIWKNEQCDQRFIQKINKKFLCAGYLAGMKDACQGDSGSPLVILDQNRIWRVQGIVSWGNKCAQPFYPGVYTRVAEFLDWIQKNRAS